MSLSILFTSPNSSICIFWTIAIVSLGLDMVIGGIKGTVGLFVGVRVVIMPCEKPMGLRGTGVGSMVNCRSSMMGVIGERRSNCVGLFRSLSIP